MIKEKKKLIIADEKSMNRNIIKYIFPNRRNISSCSTGLAARETHRLACIVNITRDATQPNKSVHYDELETQMSDAHTGGTR